MTCDEDPSAQALDDMGVIIIFHELVNEASISWAHGVGMASRPVTFIAPMTVSSMPFARN
jgi:hypothetical protein